MTSKPLEEALLKSTHTSVKMDLIVQEFDADATLKYNWYQMRDLIFLKYLYKR